MEACEQGEVLPALTPVLGFELNPEQHHAVQALTAARAFEVFLLDGVTGSGKTEVYLQFAAAVLGARSASSGAGPRNWFDSANDHALQTAPWRHLSGAAFRSCGGGRGAMPGSLPSLVGPMSYSARVRLCSRPCRAWVV